MSRENMPPLSDEQIQAVRRRLWETDLGRWRPRIDDATEHELRILDANERLGASRATIDRVKKLLEEERP